MVQLGFDPTKRPALGSSPAVCCTSLHQLPGLDGVLRAAFMFGPLDNLWGVLQRSLLVVSLRACKVAKLSSFAGFGYPTFTGYARSSSAEASPRSLELPKQPFGSLSPKTVAAVAYTFVSAEHLNTQRTTTTSNLRPSRSLPSCSSSIHGKGSTGYGTAWTRLREELGHEA